MGLLICQPFNINSDVKKKGLKKSRYRDRHHSNPYTDFCILQSGFLSFAFPCFLLFRLFLGRLRQATEPNCQTCYHAPQDDQQETTKKILR